MIFRLLYNKQSHFPPYVASLHFELYTSQDKDYYIQLFYRKDGEEHPSAMEIRGCGKKCDLDKFYDLYRDIIPDDFESECKRGGRTQEFDETDDFDENDENDVNDENDEKDD